MSTAGPGERVRFRDAVALSVALHAVLVLIPASWWQRVSFGGGGSPWEGAPGESVVLVSLFEDPGASPPEIDPPPGEPQDPPDPGPEEEKPEPVPPPPEPEPQKEIADAASAASNTAATDTTINPWVAAPASPGRAIDAGGGSRIGETVGSPGEAEPRPHFQPPRLLTGALPLDPDEVGDLEVEVPEEIPVRFRVGRDGRVLEIIPADRDLPEELVEAIRRSAEDMRFVPARVGDEPVEGWFFLTYIYRR